MMLCDELKYERLGDAFNDYPESTLVIRKQYVDAAIEELKAENKRLKEDLYKTDHHNIQYLCRMYGCDNVEAFHGEIKNLQTKLIATERALWMARHERACAVAQWHLTLSEYEEANKWDKVVQKTLAKAKEYK